MVFKVLLSLMLSIEKLELVKSRSEIKRLIKSDGIKINDQIYKENNFSLKQYASEKEVKISGNHLLLNITPKPCIK